jgi:hypothetical protein
MLRHAILLCIGAAFLTSLPIPTLTPLLPSTEARDDLHLSSLFAMTKRQRLDRFYDTGEGSAWVALGDFEGGQVHVDIAIIPVIVL